MNIGPYLKQCTPYNAEIKPTYWMYCKFYMTAFSINKIMPTQKSLIWPNDRKGNSATP